MPNCNFYGGRKRATTNFLLLSKVDRAPQEINSREFAYICHFQQIGINATVFEKREKIDVFTAVAVVDAKAPYWIAHAMTSRARLNGFFLLLAEKILEFPVRVKGGMSLRNGMWHGLRNDIIMRIVMYAE